MAIQTTYNANLTPAYAGMVTDMRNRTVLSREVMAASAVVNFGDPVMRGNTDHTCAEVGTTGAGAFLGIAVLTPTLRPASPNAYSPGDTAAVLIKGAIWVNVNAAVTPGTAAYYTSGGLITPTASGNTAITGAVFETTTTGAGLAVLRI